MPASSRKRNKGKKRKAKKDEIERAERERLLDIWLGWASGVQKYVGDTVTCDHGCGAIPDDLDLPILSFLCMISARGFSVGNLINASYTNDGGIVLKNGRYRESVVNILIRMGTNMLVSDSRENDISALTLAKSIATIEQCDDTGSLYFNSRIVSRKIRDLHTGSRRDALKFYSKRVSCSCLKSMHQEARRTFLKTGKCYHCKIEKERVALSVCSRCMITQYCSRECQVANWPEHEEDCDIYIGRERGYIEEV